MVASAVFALSACDIEEPTPDLEAEAAEVEVLDLDPATFDWELVPPPVIPGVMPAYEAPAQTPAIFPWQVDTFYFFTNPDFLSVTQAQGGLFAPSPPGMQALPPQLAEGFLLGFKFHDLSGDVVGFGSIQEVVDFENAEAVTHYMLTLPGRGTLILTQEEDNTALFAELNDMLANQEYVRSYNPPRIFINTIHGTNKIIGGTGEFAHAQGFWREFAVVNEFNFVTGVHDVGNIVQIVRY